MDGEPNYDDLRQPGVNKPAGIELAQLRAALLALAALWDGDSQPAPLEQRQVIRREHARVLRALLRAVEALAEDASAANARAAALQAEREAAPTGGVYDDAS